MCCPNPPTQGAPAGIGPIRTANISGEDALILQSGVSVLLGRLVAVSKIHEIDTPEHTKMDHHALVGGECLERGEGGESGRASEVMNSGRKNPRPNSWTVLRDATGGKCTAAGPNLEARPGVVENGTDENYILEERADGLPYYRSSSIQHHPGWPEAIGLLTASDRTDK